MKGHVNLVLSFGTLAALGGLAVWLGLESVGIGDSLRDLEQARQHGAQLEDFRRNTLSRLQARAVIVRAVVAGRMSLREAAARFRDIDATMPADFRDHGRSDYSGATEEERLCRKVIHSVVAQQDDPCLAAALGARLDEELQQLLGSVGGP
jgi:hypothetical protein